MPHHKEPPMSVKPFFQEGSGHCVGRMHQQLGFHPVDAGGVLQRLDDMGQQSLFQGARLMAAIAPSVFHVQIADYPLTTFVDEKSVSAHPASRYRCIAWQDLGIHVAQDHLSRTAIVPRQCLRPLAGLLFQQWTQVRRSEMSEVDNLHRPRRLVPGARCSSCAGHSLRPTRFGFAGDPHFRLNGRSMAQFRPKRESSAWFGEKPAPALDAPYAAIWLLAFFCTAGNLLATAYF